MAITTADLKVALDWLEAYDDLSYDEAIDEGAKSIQRVAEWMRAEIETRNIRKVAREHGKPIAEMRQLIAEAVAAGRL